MVKIFSPNPAFTSLFGLCVVRIPHIYLLSKCPAGKFFGEMAAKIAQKSNTKNKIFGGKCCENRTF